MSQRRARLTNRPSGRLKNEVPSPIADARCPAQSLSNTMRTTQNQRKASGVALLVLAAIFAVISFDLPPPRAGLVMIEGRVKEIVPAEPGKNGNPTRFRISGDERLLQYHSKSGDMGRVELELGRSSDQPVRVLIDSNDKFSTVFEVTIGGRTIRSYEEVVAAWRSGNRLGLWIAWASAIAGAVVILSARRR